MRSAVTHEGEPRRFSRDIRSNVEGWISCCADRPRFRRVSRRIEPGRVASGLRRARAPLDAAPFDTRRARSDPVATPRNACATSSRKPGSGRSAAQPSRRPRTVSSVDLRDRDAQVRRRDAQERTHATDRRTPSKPRSSEHPRRGRARERSLDLAAPSTACRRTNAASCIFSTVKDLTVAETAAVLGIPAGTVKSRCFTPRRVETALGAIFEPWSQTERTRHERHR